MENRIFKYALVASLTVHVFFLVTFWMSNIQYRKDIKEKVVEVTYQSLPVTEKKEPVKTEPVKGLKNDNKKPSLPKLLSKDSGSSPKPLASPQKPSVKLDLIEKSTSRLKGLGEKRQVKIPMLDSDKMMGPRYMNYHQQIRDRIRNRAYLYVDDPDFETGEVYLTFILSSDGRLKEIKIISEKSNANSYLTSVGLRSIKESAPFPSFPKDLDYPELTFNVIISFETEE